MNKKIPEYLALAVLILIAGSMTAVAQQHQQDARHQDFASSYIEQLDSPVRGLSTQEVDNLLNGRGAGYARLAELNGYPGPRHVLDLSSQLDLSTQQVKEIQVAFEQMQSQAKNLGRTIVNKEQKLSHAFASGNIINAELERETAELARLYGKLRTTHLQAHLQITPLLSAQQIEKYNRLRGYKMNQ